MSEHQPAILPGIPRVGRYLSFDRQSAADGSQARDALQGLVVDESLAVGIGEPLTRLWNAPVDGLRTFPALSGPGVQAPSTQHALWCWLRGDDQGELAKRSIQITDALSPAFRLVDTLDAFKHGNEERGRDLTGYEDGTENPTGDKAVAAAFSPAGSSFVAVQQWVHDLRGFGAMSQTERDNVIGRRLSDNEEIEDAPESAHVKRTEQESFSPEAIVLRRSMAFAGPHGEGLQFVAFGKTLDAFEAQLRRMVGLEDGVTDAVFRFSRAVSGAYYWCPPVSGGRLELSAA